MKAAFLDAGSLDRGDLDLTPIEGAVSSLICYQHTDTRDVVQRIGSAEVVIVNKVALNHDVLAACPRLELVCVVATGTNNVDLEAASTLGVRVVNCQRYAAQSVSQHVLGLILNLVRGLTNYSNDVSRGQWQHSPFFCRLDHPIYELGELTLGVVGYGNLGQATAGLAEGLGMRVLIAERPATPTPRAGRVGFDACLRDCDILTLHCPLSDDTEKLISDRELALLGGQGYLINTARGALVDEHALARALRERRIAGAGLDVLSQEPPRDDNPLLDQSLPNLVITPHCAWGSLTARRRIVAQTAANIRAYVAGIPKRVVA